MQVVSVAMMWAVVSVTVGQCPPDPTGPDLIAVQPVVLAAPSGLDFSPVAPPVGEGSIVAGSPFVIELWAQQLDPTLAGLNCVFVDVAFDPAAMVCNGVTWSPQFEQPFGTGVCTPGGVDELGGCTLTFGLGITPQWARIATVQATALGGAPGATITTGPAGTAMSILVCGIVPPSRVQFLGALVDFALPCATAADCADGLFCNGVEICDPTDPNADLIGCAPGLPECVGQYCDEDNDRCLDCIAAADCDDTNPCTDDLCLPNGTCLNSADDGNDASDGLFCNGLEFCLGGVIQAGTPPNCGDANPCTDDSCAEGSGVHVCVHTPDDLVDPDDGLFCNGVDVCTGGVLVVGDPPDCDDLVSCTLDSCDEINDLCVNVASDALCDNGLFCDGLETCDPDLGCLPGIAVDCADAVACTEDVCDEAGDLCVHTPLDALCDNGLFCDGAETCDAVSGCLAGVAVDCNDNVNCTIDSCNELINVCVHAVSHALCDDGLFCNGVETCHSTLDCQAGIPINTDDGVPCTLDTCDETGDTVLHTALDALCDNSLFCDGVERCDAVLGCLAGTTVSCDDGIPCTVDLCDDINDVCVNLTEACAPGETGPTDVALPQIPPEYGAVVDATGGDLSVMGISPDGVADAPGLFAEAGAPAEPRATALVRSGAVEAGGACASELPGMCQLPDRFGHGANGIVAATSDANVDSGFAAADNFQVQTTGTITSVCWWGIYVDFTSGTDCGPGTPATDVFTITYYNDDNPDGMLPGSVRAQFNVGGVTKQATGRTVSTGVVEFDEYAYTAAHPPLPVTAGECYWLEVRNATSGTCFWMWQTAPPGDQPSAQTGPGGPPYAAGAERDFDLAWCLDVAVSSSGCGPPCAQDCAPGSTPEGEPDCGIDYVDGTNGGCNAAPPLWTNISCPSGPICGTAGNFTNGGVPKRDTDWYRFTLTVPAEVTWTVTTEFEATIGFINDQNGQCIAPRFETSAFVLPCLEASVTECLYPGTWTAYVAPANVEGGVPCGAIYNAELTCNVVPECPPKTVCEVADETMCQLPDLKGHGVHLALGATSDDKTDFVAADDFTVAVDGTIDEVCWWGMYIDFAGSPSDCGPGTAPDDFTITYYDDGGTVPGSNVLAGPFHAGTVPKATRRIIGTGGFPIIQYEYTATHDPFSVTAGQCYWIEITNDTNPNDACVWMWETAPAHQYQGDRLSAQDDSGMHTYELGEENNYDLAWCLGGLDPGAEPDGCDVTGACCRPAGFCEDDVTAADCLFEDGGFTADTLCADLDPVCKIGGCCAPDGSCADVLEGDCPGPWEGGLNCVGKVCAVFDSCSWDNGTADPSRPTPATQLADGEFYAESADNFVLEGSGEDPCEIREITWWVRHFNAGPSGGGCTAGICDGTSAPCDALAPDACDSGAGGNCVRNNPDCTNTPDDYSGVMVTIYNDAFDPGTLEALFQTDCNQPIPQGPFESANCTSQSDCAAGELCVDNDGDGGTECTVVCPIDVSGQSGSVNDLDLELLIEHPWQGDLVVSLEHVGFGPPVRLMNKPGDTDLHPGGFGPDGYHSDDFGDPTRPDYRLVLNDQAKVSINEYDGDGGGRLRYLGPAVSGGGGEPGGVLASFSGLPKDGTWLLYVSDEGGGAHTGSLLSWSLRFNAVSPVPPGPTGFPEHVVEPYECTIADDCVDAGCPLGSVCSGGFCEFDGSPCGPLVPTGGHVGLIKHEIQLTPAQYTWAPCLVAGQPVPDCYVLTLDLSAAGLTLEQNKQHLIAVAPILPFEGYYQTGSMVSQKRDTLSAQHVFEPLGVFPWRYVPNEPRDLAFSITGASQTGCPNATADECCDVDGNGLIDDVCTWCACVPPCDVVTTAVPADVGGSFGVCQPDGFCNIHDANTVLACFADTTTCDTVNIEAGGPFGECAPDGFCNIHDANHALACFAGMNTCSCAPAPQSHHAPAEAGTATLSAIARSRSVRPGDLVRIDVLITETRAVRSATHAVREDRSAAERALKLQGYQLHAAVSGGRGGGLELVGITIDPRSDYVFRRADDNFSAFNAQRGQMLNGLPFDRSETAAAGAYLATYTYRVSADAAGTFVFDLLHDEPQGDQTFLIAPGNGRIEVATAPAVIVVTR